MNKKLFFVIALALLQFYTKAQYCTSDKRFTQTPVFTDAQIQEDSMVYANALDWQGVNQALKLTVFYPGNSAETLLKRPMIMMIYGGAFTGGNRGQVTAYCTNFAKRGFVAVAIDYRLGKETVTPCADTLSQEKAVYRAQQDAHAAMRYMVANATTYKIDTSWIFAGGYSAGAGTANALVYNSQAELNLIYPGIVSALGNINNSGNALTNTFTIKGIFNNWGGVSSDFFDISDAIPTVSFHGGVDGVVPIDSAIDMTCFTTNHYIYGSHAMYQKMTAAGICGDLTVKTNGGHGVYQGGDGVLMRVSRATCFFKSIFCHSCINYLATDSVTPNCSNTTTAITKTTLQNNKVSIYPNPASTEIKLNLDVNKESELEIVNLLGDVCISVKNAATLDISLLTNGVYFIKIRQGTDFYSQKIIKQ